MKIDYKELADRLKVYDRRIELINYIYKRQGCGLARLDFSAAANELEVDRKTVANYVNQLGALGVIVFSGDALRLSPAVLTDD